MGVRFDTRLHLTWALFFDLAGWKWRYKPEYVDDSESYDYEASPDYDVDVLVDMRNYPDCPSCDWVPTFWVSFPCSHSDCNDSHELYVTVEDRSKIFQLQKTPFDFWGQAAFGNHPDVTKWTMTHGSGGGEYEVPGWVYDSDTLWQAAKRKAARVASRRRASSGSAHVSG